MIACTLIITGTYPPVPPGIDFYIEKDACRGSGCPVSVVRRLCHAVRIAEEKMNVKKKLSVSFRSGVNGVMLFRRSVLRK